MSAADNKAAPDWDNERKTSKPGSSSSSYVNVSRRVYRQDRLNRDADYQPLDRPCEYQHPPIDSYFYKKFLYTCGIGDCLRHAVPMARWLPRYKRREYLLGDLVAGATTAVMHIPQGMAYAMLAEVPPIVGLYMAFFPVLVYVILGTSPHVSMGTFAVACLMTGKVVTKFCPPHPHLGFNSTNITDTGPLETHQYTPVQVASVVCFTVGLYQVCMWVLRLGAVSTLLSEPLVSGFTTAASFFVLASQLKDLFGVRLPPIQDNFKVIRTVLSVFSHLHTVNWAAFSISAVTCLVMAFNNEILKPIVSKKSRVPVPIELLIMMVATLTSGIGEFHELYGISLVGDIPTGLPSPSVPPVELLPSVALDALTITVITYTVTMSMALIFAHKDKYEIDANQELLALGASNIFASFFSCVPFCASLSRSYLQHLAGSKTGVTSVVSAVLVLCVLLWVGPFFELLPRCVLASIIVVSLKGMYMQVAELITFWKLSKLDAVVWVVTFVTTMTVNIDVGLYVGLLASLGALFFGSQKPYTCLLGRVHDTDIYLDIKRYRAAQELPGIKIFHYCGGLTFATKNLFASTLYRKVGYMRPHEALRADVDAAGTNPWEWDPTIGNRVGCVVLDASALAYVDAAGVRALAAVCAALAASHIRVLMAGANGPVLEMIGRYNRLQREQDRLQLSSFPTVHDAVTEHLRAADKQRKAQTAAAAAVTLAT